MALGKLFGTKTEWRTRKDWLEARERCERCNKTCYENKGVADAQGRHAARVNKLKHDMRSYPCAISNSWHLTSKK